MAADSKRTVGQSLWWDSAGNGHGRSSFEVDFEKGDIGERGLKVFVVVDCMSAHTRAHTCAHICTGASACVCACACGGLNSTLLFLRNCPPCIFLRQGLSLAEGSQTSLGWLAAEPQEPACFCLLVLGFHGSWRLNLGIHICMVSTLPRWDSQSLCFEGDTGMR